MNNLIDEFKYRMTRLDSTLTIIEGVAAYQKSQDDSTGKIPGIGIAVLEVCSVVRDTLGLYPQEVKNNG